jgi:hypothetical protein
VTAVLKEPLMKFRNIEASRIFAALIVAFGAGSSALAAREPVIPPTPGEIPAPQGQTSHGASCGAKPTLSERLAFASADRSRKILGHPDEWAHQLSDFDRGARQRTLEPTTRQGFLEFASNAAISWSPDEEAYWSAIADRLSDATAGLDLKIPHIFLVKTTGGEEFDSAYTRHRSIVLPASFTLAADERRDFFLLAHELFHVLSRENPAQRHALYALLGFKRLAKFEYPPELEERRLSNPDAHSYDHALSVDTGSGNADVVAVIQSTISLEDLLKLPGADAIFGVLDIVLLAVDRHTGEVLRDDSGSLIKYNFGNTDWVQRMLRNSSYIIDPEELMADNFATLMEWRANGFLASENPSGFPANDINLLVAIENVLRAGCGG